MTLSAPAFDYEDHLAACARGDRQALRRLYDVESPRLLGVARRLVKDTALAEDVVHDAFIRIWTRAATFDPARGSGRGWMFSITRHLALDFLRSQERDVELDERSEPALTTTGELDGLLHGARLNQCLDQLEPLRRACLVHAYVDGYSHAEIAHKLDSPLGTVKAWVKRSLAALRECMG
ncbi:sigma-70 family RNA polymerase sigma factor [Pseudomonas putida]|uniref:RNA polymerase subunit sigma n=1 Tax=Pseudomonas putida TaxID=303 RepID=A0A177SGL2_PSEPU|nr:sigma-70 family RNA polymerase sigma factor [Pseudomonas putida]OAI88302.1 RNA polymerase subunit sigma [Pseudomonas putida]